MERGGNINLYRNSFLEKEELDRLFQFGQNDMSKLLYTINAQSFGVVISTLGQGFENSFKVQAGTNAGTIKIAQESYAINKGGGILYQDVIDNYPIKDVNGQSIQDEWAWVKIEKKFEKHEVGFVSIDADGNVSGINTKFTEVFRGQGSGFPAYISLFKQEDNGELTPSTNNGIYEVNDVIGDNSMILNGRFVPESNLRVVCMGSFTLGEEASALQAGGLYNYDGTKISFVKEVFPDYPPTASLDDGMSFFIARVRYNSATAITDVEDKRKFQATNPTTGFAETFDFYYKLNFGDILVNNKADVDGGNIPSVFQSNWQSALGVYSKTNVDSLLNGKANVAGGNISNKTQWRTNLDVPSVADLAGYAKIDASNLESGNVTSWKTKLGVVDTPDTGWLDCVKPTNWTPTSFTIKARKVGNVVNITGKLDTNGRTIQDKDVLFTVPSSIPPAPNKVGMSIYSHVNVALNIRSGGDGSRSWLAHVPNDASGVFYFNITYLA